MEEKKWYVIKTQNGYENKVRDNLESNVRMRELDDQVDDIIVPKQIEVEVRNGKVKEREKKIYPGFILIKMDMDDKLWFAIRNTSGVFGLLGSSGGGTKPIPLKEHDVQRFFAQDGKIVYKNSNLKKGQRIEMLHNLFLNKYGIVEEVDNVNHKVTVSVEGKTVTVELGEVKVA